MFRVRFVNGWVTTIVGGDNGKPPLSTAAVDFRRHVVDAAGCRDGVTGDVAGIFGSGTATAEAATTRLTQLLLPWKQLG